MRSFENTCHIPECFCCDDSRRGAISSVRTYTFVSPCRHTVLRTHFLLYVADRAFPVAGPRVWNARPHHLTCDASFPDYRSRPKTSRVCPGAATPTDARHLGHFTLSFYSLTYLLTYLLTWLRFAPPIARFSLQLVATGGEKSAVRYYYK